VLHLLLALRPLGLRLLLLHASLLDGLLQQLGVVLDLLALDLVKGVAPGDVRLHLGRLVRFALFPQLGEVLLGVAQLL